MINAQDSATKLNLDYYIDEMDLSVNVTVCKPYQHGLFIFSHIRYPGKVYMNHAS